MELPYNGNLSWLKERTIYLTRHGSHAYGTNIATSDLDLKGVAIPPKSYFLGFLDRFEQAEQRTPVDFVIYDIRKFFALAADCNPNIIEVLWTDASDVLMKHPIAERMLAARELFLSRKAKHTFSGYATAQLKRINTHYRWLKSPPVAAPTRAEFGLPEKTVIPQDQLQAAWAAISKKLDSWEPNLDGVEPAARIRIMSDLTEMLADMSLNSDTKWVAAGRSVGYDTNFLELLDRERRYKSKHTEWEQYQEWKKKRNPDRAALEEKWGYDTKHALHLVRLMRMCREILETGQVLVKRPDKDELLAIRGGAWTYEQLVEWANKEDKALDEVVQKSKLPWQPDRKKLNALCVEMVEAF